MKAGIIIVKKINNKWKVLALRYYKKYDITKGTIEHGETEFQAALRETKEESNITNLNFQWGYQSYSYRNITLYVASTRQKGKIIKNPETGIYEHHELKWVTWDHMLRKVYKYLIPGIKWAQNIVEN